MDGGIFHSLFCALYPFFWFSYSCITHKSSMQYRTTKSILLYDWVPSTNWSLAWVLTIACPATPISPEKYFYHLCVCVIYLSFIPLLFLIPFLYSFQLASFSLSVLLPASFLLFTCTCLLVCLSSFIHTLLQLQPVFRLLSGVLSFPFYILFDGVFPRSVLCMMRLAISIVLFVRSISQVYDVVFVCIF